jgi:hypothetical protein
VCLSHIIKGVIDTIILKIQFSEPRYKEEKIQNIMFLFATPLMSEIHVRTILRGWWRRCVLCAGRLAFGTVQGRG